MDVRIGSRVLDPRRNPAILDTGTWAREEAWGRVDSIPDVFWTRVAQAANRHEADAALPGIEGFTPFHMARFEGAVYVAAHLADGQRVIVSLSPGSGPSALPALIGEKRVGASTRLSCYPVDIDVVKAFVTRIAHNRGPQALGQTPRIGIGCRMSVAVWPGIWRAMTECGFGANAIQNSLRELRLYDEVRSGIPPRTNHQFSFGAVQEGHTGSTFEGLWLEGVLAALAAPADVAYGADADHIMVKRSEDGLERAMRIIDAARYYTFYTLDVSDLLDYGALSSGASGDGRAILSRIVPDKSMRHYLIEYHANRGRKCGYNYSVYDETIGRLCCKYWRALDAAERLARHLDSIKDGEPFDLEISIDENPPEVETCDSVTTEAELLFIIFEAERRQIPLSHLAPNLGVEKGTDYRCPDGLEGLSRRVSLMSSVCRDYGVMLDVHSGDDLSPETVRRIGSASTGRLHFKVSPSLQTLFGRAIYETDKQLFAHWWDLSAVYARELAEGESEAARKALARAEEAGDEAKTPDSDVFHHFCFAPVGKVDGENRLVSREWFYTLPQSVYDRYTELLNERLCRLSRDLYSS